MPIFKIGQRIQNKKNILSRGTVTESQGGMYLFLDGGQTFSLEILKEESWELVPFPRGAEIKNGGLSATVLEELGDHRLISPFEVQDRTHVILTDDFNKTKWMSIRALQMFWQVVDEEKKEEWPKEGDEFWHLTMKGSVISETWYDSVTYRNMRDFLGIFRTREEAEARLAEIKKKLGE